MNGEQRETQPRVGWVIGALLVVMLLASLDQTIVSTALPTGRRCAGWRRT